MSIPDLLDAVLTGVGNMYEVKALREPSLQPKFFKMESSDTITAACIIAGAIILVHFLR
jgi:hypothetical protein